MLILSINQLNELHDKILDFNKWSSSQNQNYDFVQDAGKSYFRGWNAVRMGNSNNLYLFH